MSFSMGFELFILAILFFIFIGSFCGLLKKIRISYENERRQAALHNARTISSVYVNPSYMEEGRNGSNLNPHEGGIFPGAPPPYTEYYLEPPPKYEDIVKVHNPPQNTNLPIIA